MPTVLIYGRFRFYFFSNEGLEPPHIHVDAAEKSAKYWLTPIELQMNKGFRSGERKEIEQLIQANLEYFLRTWNEYFSKPTAHSPQNNPL